MNNCVPTSQITQMKLFPRKHKIPAWEEIRKFKSIYKSKELSQQSQHFPQREAKYQLALLVNSNKCLKENEHQSKPNQNQKSRRGGNTSQLTLCSQHCPDTKTRLNHHIQRKSIALVNTDAKISSKILENRIHQHISKNDYTP